MDHEITDGEADEALNNLAGLFEILIDSAQKEEEMKRKLKSSPEGYDITGLTYSCCVCHRSATWYDKRGKTCAFCCRAFREGVIPYFIAHESKSYFKSWMLKEKFKIPHPTMKKYIKEGKLIARIIRSDTDRPHEYIFLKKENLGLIERYSPERKSYDRKRNKLHKRQMKDWKEQIMGGNKEIMKT